MMKQYYNKEETPLAFHKFFWYVSLPLGFLISTGRIISEISEMLSFNWLYAAEICYYILVLTLIPVCFIGFFQWKSYAWYGVITYLCINVAYSLFTVFVYAIYIPNQVGTAIGQLLGFLIYAVLVGIYYKKRRSLFFSNITQINASSCSESVDITQSGNLSLDNPPLAKYCHKCGYELLNGSAFCSKCGTSVIPPAQVR